MSEKWQTVGKKERKGSKKDAADQHEKHGKPSARATGLEQSNTAFSQWSQLEQSREAAGRASEGDSGDDGVLGGHFAKEEGSKLGAEGVRHRGKTKKEKKSKTTFSFEEAVSKLDVSALLNHVEDLKNENPETPLVWLKGMTTNLQMQFKDVQPETDYVFSDQDAAYPASALPSSLRTQLMSSLRSCSTLALESLYRHCLDSMLSEVKGGVSSMGSRIVIQLLRETNPQICTAATEKIRILLQSCGTKVPESLSLLWAGLLCPKLHPLLSLSAWQYICLPFLHQIQSVPRQVFGYCLSYTSLLLRHLRKVDVTQLCSCLPPGTLCAVLSSQALVSRRAQADVQEMCQLLLDHLLPCESIGDYFSACFIELGHSKHTELLMDFVIASICSSPSCLSLWKREAPTSIQSSQCLLNRLVQHWNMLRPRLSLSKLDNTLNHIHATITVHEHRQLCQELQERVKQDIRTTRESGRHSESVKCSCGRVFCGLLLVILAVSYLSLLAVFLFTVATKGPVLEAEMLSRITTLDQWRSFLDQATVLMWDCLSWCLHTLGLGLGYVHQLY